MSVPSAVAIGSRHGMSAPSTSPSPHPQGAGCRRGRAQPARLRARPRELQLGGGARGARRPARRARAEHRPRGGRPPRRGGPRRARARCAGSAARARRATLSYAELADGVEPLRRTRSRELGVQPRRARVRLLRAGPGALRRGARHAQARRRLLPAVLGLRARAAAPAAGARRRPRAGHDRRRSTSARSRRCARRCPTSSTCCSSATAPATATTACAPRAAARRAVRRLRDPADRSRRTRRCCTSRAARPARPKGAVHVHEAVVAHHATGALALDLHPDDVFWCTADPGWVTGTSYGIIAPLTHGVTLVVDEARVRRRALVPHPRRASA